MKAHEGTDQLLSRVKQAFHTEIRWKGVEQRIYQYGDKMILCTYDST